VSAHLLRLAVYLAVPAASFAGAMGMVTAVAPAGGRRLGTRRLAAGLLAAVALGVTGVVTGRLAGMTGPVAIIGTVYVAAAVTPLADVEGRSTALLPAVAGVVALGAVVPIRGAPGPLLPVIPALGLSSPVGVEVVRPDGRPEIPALAAVLGFVAGIAVNAWPAVVEGSVSGLAVTLWLFVALGVATLCAPLVAAGAALAGG
jgi:hypothetical protein